MELAEIHRVSVADQVASILRQRILDGELIPGTALQEVPMAASLGVSRNTVREATRILSLEGLLKRSAHRGVTVAQLSLEDVGEIYRLRHLLEIPAVRAARMEHSAVLAEMRNALEGYEEAVEGLDWVVLVDLRHDNPGGLVPVHRRIFELLTGGKTEECASLLAQHLRDSETRLTAVMDQRIARTAK
ncbi:MAG: hypothetical protein DMG51_20460 [Acidobacteria bacterium]|nr:MAG: hypothetical protein DMG51_20460 [Acidobacteriota bacterium]